MTRATIIHILDGTDPAFGTSVAWFLNVVIGVSAATIALETMPGLSPALYQVLGIVEWFVLVVFTLEYLTRLICSPNPLRYAISFWGIIDLLSCLPILSVVKPEWAVLRSFRLLRALRLLKLFRSSRALDRLAHALDEVRDELLLFVVLAVIMLYVSAVGIYVFENEAQPDVFSSIPHSFWWAIASFTTVGYGDMVPITLGGRVFTSFILFIGLGVVAVPAAIVTTALLEAETNVRPRHPSKKKPKT
ncbi:ion transporter [Falsihalocynthiibacter arcticus]|uniref:Voltage-gated potassium channel n=1 Tax=Falsihalocynthiibacter arcticus TaxID=1579316 RepID=A0A126UW51_9RHOB|nr:ion transporter [Falsihalocynthiibacter arcticus]AML50107.1 voltage-gated potassium channel [Falsihalocynthiibacter arcticus]